jgi:hypothetical protein
LAAPFSQVSGHLLLFSDKRTQSVTRWSGLRLLADRAGDGCKR